MNTDCIILDDLGVDAEGRLTPSIDRQPREVTVLERPSVSIDLNSRTQDTSSETVFSTGVSPIRILVNNTGKPVAVGLRYLLGGASLQVSSPKSITLVTAAGYGNLDADYRSGYIDAVGAGIDAGTSGSTRYFAQTDHHASARTVYTGMIVLQPGDALHRNLTVALEYSGFTGVQIAAEEVNRVVVGSIREDLIISPIV